MLLALHAAESLPVVILRPGLVVGEGTSPFHSGLGFYNTEQHCIGWNARRQPACPSSWSRTSPPRCWRAIRAEGIEGRCYNLVGDVRPNARNYIAALAEALRRPLRYHPQWPTWLWLEDIGEMAIKRAHRPAVADAEPRAISSPAAWTATFDCSDAKRDLDWHPDADADRFLSPVRFGP